ncbi:Central glycolytic genes regulator [Paraliobacillus sp. PM-2]|uniref:sugar-binding transcriptional regulator n=1 Tax=Paraliobacillus sp. PM-2 TaxID=1462524 RepID=UPI00061C34DF|nr:sugar-binding domain-containing protein [Paraliobacillus sp. PM-2]CQR46493.1 Central glycolytic genes regulator [Paraliobacillus sp. PM-2]
MKNWIDVQKKLFPDLVDVMQRRYKILHFIHVLEPIGRRSLAEHVHMKERIVRSEIDFLNSQALLEVTTKGMKVTSSGHQVLQKLETFMSDLFGFDVLEKQIKDTLNLEHVLIIPGNSDEDHWVKQELGKATVDYLKTILQSNQTIAVTGGTTMAAVAEMMRPSNDVSGCLFVPARGGLGERVENQANTICAEMAKKINGEYRLLYVPDPLSEDTYQSIIEEPSVKEILQIIRQANIVVHGIGNAVTMAKRRKASNDVLHKIQLGNAVSEAFGYYFSDNGEVIHKVRTVGMQLEDLSKIRDVIAVAGGKTKAKAIHSYCKQGKSNVLITDEAAAKELIKGFSL